jgi:hypothetical protein
VFSYQRQAEVRQLLFRYLESPSLRLLRDPKQVDRLAEKIVATVDQSSPLWLKWDAARGELLKASAKTWPSGSRAKANGLTSTAMAWSIRPR